MPGETTSIVIMGASGDLTSRKLLPALFNLWLKGRLPGTFNIVGMARSAMSDSDFRDLMWNGVAASGNLAGERDRWDEFAARLRYCEGDLGDLSHMARLGKVLEEVEEGRGRSIAYSSSPSHPHSTPGRSPAWGPPASPTAPRDGAASSSRSPSAGTLGRRRS